MGQRYSSCAPYARLPTQHPSGTLAMLHAAIVEGESELANQLVEALRSGRRKAIKCDEDADEVQQWRQHQLYLDYRGETRFGIEIRYTQTALALAIQFGQWATFKELMECGLSPRAQQRMLVAGRPGQSSTRDFGTALELFVWALTKASYFPPYLSEAEVEDLLRVIMRHGVPPDTLPAQLLLKVTQAAVLDIVGGPFLGLETTTVLQRSALSILRCLMQHGLSLSRATADNLQPLHHLVLCFLAEPSESARQLQSNRKLRLALCILINAACNSTCRGGAFPTVTAVGLTNARWRSTAMLWHYYSKIRGRQQLLVDKEDVARVLRAHQAITEACATVGHGCQRPPRLALLARNRVRALLQAGVGSAGHFAGAVASLPRQLRQLVEFMDEEFLAPEIAAIQAHVRD